MLVAISVSHHVLMPHQLVVSDETTSEHEGLPLANLANSYRQVYPPRIHLVPFLKVTRSPFHKSHVHVLVYVCCMRMEAVYVCFDVFQV